MTDPQRIRFYFPAWHQVCAAHGWHMERGRFSGARLEAWGAQALTEVYHAVWEAAGELAVQNHRGVVAENLRHACHVVALGEDKSSRDLVNWEVERVVHLFRLLADPDDLEAAMQYFQPQNALRKRTLWTLEHRFHEAQVIHLALDIFGTSDWRTLSTDALMGLRRALYRTAKRRLARETVSGNCPF
jgi:hypothetical protein